MGEGLLPECSVRDPQHRQLKLKHEWQLFVCAATDDQRQVVHMQYKFNMDGHGGGWAGRFQARAMHIKTALINTVKLSSWFQCKALSMYV